MLKRASELMQIYEGKSEAESKTDHTGMFAGCVLLSGGKWDKAQFIRDIKGKWDITVDEGADGNENDDIAVFNVGNLLERGKLYTKLGPASWLETAYGVPCR